ncbi:MAG TPA: AAC(3) family N-acetyltransferase [Actinophytocola sp.]|uniref:aminoglycoside N(3)-acetyltransferase n=1 Tax=Actinophytocola sp. TaxID=1872138 RepID=UPI002F934C50
MPDGPRTRATLATDLAALGLRASDVVLVHSSLSKLGWVCGGAVAVVQALLDVLGPLGTLVVPTQTMDNSDPRHWSNPPVPESWWPVIREAMPGFDPRVTPSTGIGAIGEMVRRWPGAVRSNHPHASFAAVGARAPELMAEHRLDSHLGERSPLAALERADARVLLLGVGFESCTAFHLAEYRVPSPRTEFGCAVLTETGDRKWITYEDVATNSDDFAALGADFLRSGAVIRGRIGEADAHLFEFANAVEHAVRWLPDNRPQAN